MNIRTLVAAVFSVLLLAGCGLQTPAAAESGKIPALTDDTFEQAVASGVVLVDFWAPWCGPCRMQGPLVEQAAEKLGAAAKVVKVNVDVAGKSAEKYGIRSIPTLIVFKDGKPAKQFVGVTQADALVEAVRSVAGAK